MYITKGAPFDVPYHELGHHAVSKMTQSEKTAFAKDVRAGKVVPVAGMNDYESQASPNGAWQTDTRFGEFIAGLFRQGIQGSKPAINILTKYGIWALAAPFMIQSNKKKK